MKNFLHILPLIFWILLSSEFIFAQQEQVDPSLAEVEQSQVQQMEKVNDAFIANEAVKKAGAYIESISDLINNQEITLPVGIKKGEYELIIQKIKYNKETGRPNIFATCAFQFKDDGQKIAFEGSADIEGQKGLGTNGYLEIIAPVRRNLGKHVAIVFNKGTKVNFGCEGIESYKAKIDLIVTSEKIVAVKQDGTPTGKSLSSSFEASFYDFDNFTASFSFNQFFSFKGLKDIIFNLKGATLDQSDIETSSLVEFPKDYFPGENQNELKLWKGIAISEATVLLPAIFKKSSVSNDTSSVNNPSLNSTSDRIELGLNNVLLDDNGFSGSVIVKNIMSSNAIDKSKWDITVNDFLLTILKNDPSGFGFGGDVNIPPFGNNSLLPYMAKFNPGIGEYEFTVNVSGDYEFAVLRSTLSLNETSTIQILFKGADIYPTINANGQISIDAPINESDTTKKFTLPDVKFENLKISRDEPYVRFGSIDVAGDIQSPKIAGFGLSVTDIRSFNDNSGSGLAFEAGIKLSKMFGGEAGLKLYGNYSKWEFDHVGVDKINIDFQSKAFSLNGGVWLKNSDTIYGSGFRGDVKLKLLDKFELDAVAVFGKKDDYRYFLTDVFFEVPPSSGIPVPPALSFYGFGGGIYKKMQQSFDPNIDSDFGKSLSGINYVPDRKVGMGFMAATKFGLISSPTLFNAKVAFEMQFNTDGGVNFIQLRGDASFMNDPEKWGKLADNLNEKVKKLEEADGKLKLSAKSDLKVPENKSSGFLTASMNVKYDLANKVFSADLNTYLNAGFIKGVGKNDRMGWASAYFSPDKWYTYIGTPKDRVGIKVLNLAKMDGYFMVGDDIPELPLPPQKVLQNLSSEKRGKLKRKSELEEAAGSGMAFGLSLGVDFKATLPPFYASIGAGLGSEFLLKGYGEEAYCVGGNSNLGINGWYARAQAWAWVQADIGLEAKIFKKTRKFSILDISAAALLEGAGPNPFYFTGSVGGHFNVMGGLISGQCDFDFEIGEECIIKGGNPFGVGVIAQLTPGDGEDDINVFASPQAVFNIPVGLQMEVEEEGNKVFYKITLEEFKVHYKENKKVLTGNKKFDSEGKVYMLDPAEPFESQKDMVVYAKVGFKRKLNGKWVDVKDSNGSPFFEEKQIEFKSGDRPKEILAEHVKYSYPIKKQYNFYPKEYSNGYIHVTENYSYLFSTEKPVGVDQVIRFTDFDGKSSQTNFTYKTNSSSNKIRLEINFSMQNVDFINDEIYKMAIVNVPQNSNVGITSNISTTQSSFNNNDSILITTQQADGTLDILDEKEIYALNFRTSKYNTLSEKMNNYNTKGTGWRDYVEPFVHHIKANITESEFFDRNEIWGINGDNPIIQFEAQLGETNWYSKSGYKKMYGTTNYNEIEAARNEIDPYFNDFGFPPIRAVVIQNKVNDKQLTEGEIQTGTPSGTFAYGIFTYALPYWCSRDFYIIKTKIANKVSRGRTITKEEEAILATNFPYTVTKGVYPVKIKYVLPGKNITTSIIDVEMYNPIN